MLTELIFDDPGGRFAEWFQDVREHLEEMHVEAAFTERLRQFDANVAAPDDADPVRFDDFTIPFDATVDRVTDISSCTHRLERVHAVEICSVDRRDQRPRPGCNYKVVVRLFERSIVGLDGDRLFVGVDPGHFVTGSEVDVTLFTERLGVHDDQVIKPVYVSFHVVREPTGTIRNPLTTFEDDHLLIRNLTFELACCAHPGRVATDDDSRGVVCHAHIEY